MEQTTIPATSHASPSQALSKMATHLRSVLGNAFGLPLLLLLDFLDNLGPVTTIRRRSIDAAMEEYLSLTFASRKDLAFLDTIFPNFSRESASSAIDRESLSRDLGITIRNWFGLTVGRNETRLTKDLCEAIDNNSLLLRRAARSFALQKPNKPNEEFHLRSTGEVNIQNENERGRYDVLVTDNVSGDPLILFEFGLDMEIWWQKLDQGRIFVDILCSHASTTVVKSGVTLKQFDKKPMMLSIVTLDKQSGVFKIALFLCWRKVSRKIPAPADDDIIPKFYVALLWRKQSDDANTIHQKQEALVNALANTLVTALWLQSKWTVDVDPNAYSVLGPNCCKIKDKVSCLLILYARS
jgi:hypothetical protein